MSEPVVRIATPSKRWNLAIPVCVCVCAKRRRRPRSAGGDGGVAGDGGRTGAAGDGARTRRQGAGVADLQRRPLAQGGEGGHGGTPASTSTSRLRHGGGSGPPQRRHLRFAPTACPAARARAARACPAERDEREGLSSDDRALRIRGGCEPHGSPVPGRGCTGADTPPNTGEGATDNVGDTLTR